MSTTTTQLHPPAPAFTESSLLDLSQKVYLLTGATSGTGLALAQILYNLHATIYIGARSASSYSSTVNTLKAQCPASKGSLKPFIADLADLSALKPAVEDLLAKEWRLDVLFLNAGVRMPKEGDSKAKTKKRTRYRTRRKLPRALPARVIALSPNEQNSIAFLPPQPLDTRNLGLRPARTSTRRASGVQFDVVTGAPRQFKGMQNYMQSKAGVYLLAREFPKRQREILVTYDAAEAHTLPGSNPSGVQHVAINPGFTRTNIQRHMGVASRGVMSAVSKSPVYGAYTALYAGLAPEVRSDDFVIPWGRKGSVPAHIMKSTVAEEGEESVSSRFYDWCNEQVKPFM